MSASPRKRPSNHHIAIRRFVPIRVINAVQQISTGLPSYLGLWSARWHPPGRRTVKTEPLSGSLATVMSPPIMRASLRKSARPSPVPPSGAP
jgi:hypothetical protein